MKNFTYSVIITTEDNRFTYETNDVREAIGAMFECDIEDAHICICNGYTGEVLYHNGDEPWCTDEMALMMLGFVVEQAGAEEEEEDEPVEVVEVPGMGLVSAFLAEVLGLPGDAVIALPPAEGLPS